MRKSTSGFTILEVLVVVAVIAILAAISIVSFSRYQTDSRDTQRSSRATIIAEALEKYYDENGEYPSCNSMTNTGTYVTTNVLPGVDPTVLRTPQAAADQTNSIDFCTTLSPTSPTDSFAYVGDGSGACTTTACLQFTIQYKEESSGDVVSITSRRTTDILTSGDITNLVATTYSFSQVDLTWGAIGGATTYDIQRATNDTFTANMQESSVSTNSGAVTGLTLNTLYYFRVRPVSAGDVKGNWSNIANATTYSLNTPSGTPTVNSGSQITYSWGLVANATNYAVQYSNNSSFANSPSPNFSTLTANTSSPRVVSGLNAGTTLYFRIRSEAAGYTSGWSTTTSATTTITPPSSYTITETSRNWNTLNAISNAVCPNSGTVPYYRWTVNGSTWVEGTQYQSVSYTGISWNQDITLTVTTSCTANSVFSTYTAATNSLSHTTLDSPSAWAGNCATRTACWSGGCPTYTTSGYIHWWVNSAVQGAPWVAGDTGLGGTYTWYSGGTWGDGDVRSTTYCYGPWGTATAGGWGPFGSGCVPTIRSGWCTV